MKTTIINKILLVLMLITAQQVSALEFQVDGIYYRTSIFTKNSAYVTHSGTSYTESVEYQGEVVIPESVTYNGKTYTIASIGGYAFAGCPGLTSVTIPNTVTTINQNAFNGCTGLKTIECKATTPPALGDNAFTSYDATLVVPSSSESVYKSAAGWSNFKFKEESSETPGSGENSGEDNTGGGSDSGEDNGSDNGSDSGSDSGSDNGGDSGSSTVPEACYLVGYYNGWYTPTEENVDELYTLTDPDKDGVYYGKFYFDKGQFSFKIFITIGGWESGNYFGTDRKITMDNITGFLSVSYEGSAYNFECSDWNGGYVEIFFDFKNNTIRFLFPNENPILSYNIISETKVEVIAGTEKYTGDIVIPSLVTISGKTYKITQIATRAFDGCTDLTSVTIPNSVTFIGAAAFRGCSGLTSITIPNSVTSIGGGAFEECTGLTIVNIFDLEAWCKIDFYYSYANPLNYAKNLYLNGELLTNLEIPNTITKIKQYAFSGCRGLTSVTIPEGVTSIGTYAFGGCTGLTSITIPNSVTSIGDHAFYNCSGLTSITIPEGVTSIGANAFSGCSGLTSITIPNSVTSIGGYAFNGCSGLTSITIPNSVTSINQSAFKGCSGLTSITIPNSVTSIGDHAFYNCSGLTSITIPEGVTSIGYAAFNGCSGLTSITIPNSVTSIGDYAFYGCGDLSSITIPNSVTSIGDFAFAFCSGLTRVIFNAENCETMGSSSSPVFENCTSLSSVTIGENVKNIPSYAFCGCSSLTLITIPNSVTSIGESAFAGCRGLTSVTSLNTTPPTCGTSVFGNVSVGNIILQVPAESVSMYENADTWNDFGTIKGIVVEESGGSDNEEIISGYKITKQWTVPADATTGFCSVRTATGYGDSLFGSNYQAGVIEEWKGGVLVASYDVNKFCADNNLGETVKVKDEAGNETEKFQSYLLWTAVMVDDAGNLLVNVGTVLAAPNTCQNWVLLPASDRNAMQLLHIDEFPSADVTPGRVDVPSRIVGNITDGGAYLYIPATNSALMPVMYIALDGDGKIYYDAENSWILMSSVTFDSSTNVATFQTADEILGAADEAGVAAKTYVRWRGQVALFTWNAETSQFEKNTAIPQGAASTPGMDIFKIGDVEYIVVPVLSASTGKRGSSVAVYSLADGTEVASWDATSAVDYYLGSVQARVNPDGKTANIYVCGHKDCFGILKFYPGSSVNSIANEGLSYGKDSSALDEIVTEENTDVEYYNLQGVRVMNPEKGIYIKRQGGKTSKVVL